MNYHRARYYDMSAGIWNRLDPYAGNHSDPQSLHKYAYCHGDPVNGVDPSGEMTLTGMMGSLAVKSILVNMLLTTIMGIKHGQGPMQIAGNIAINLGFFMLIAAAIMGSTVAAVVLIGAMIWSVCDLVPAIIEGRLDYIDLLLIAGMMATYAGFAAGFTGAIYGGVTWESPVGTRFSQRTITRNNYAKLMERGKWNWRNPKAIIDRVKTTLGEKVSLGNRRLDAALESNQQKVPFRDHNFSEPLPTAWLKDPWIAKHKLKTWGDLLTIRTKKNRLPLEGTQERPTMK